MKEFFSNVAGPFIGAAASIVATVVTLKYTQGLERRKIVWEKEINRLIDLEELAGEIAESSGRYRRDDGDQIIEKLNSLEFMAGKLARHKELRQAIRDFEQSVKILINDKMNYQDTQGDSRLDAEKKYKSLISAIDKVLSR